MYEDKQRKLRADNVIARRSFKKQEHRRLQLALLVVSAAAGPVTVVLAVNVQWWVQIVSVQSQFQKIVQRKQRRSRSRSSVRANALKASSDPGSSTSDDESGQVAYELADYARVMRLRVMRRARCLDISLATSSSV